MSCKGGSCVSGQRLRAVDKPGFVWFITDVFGKPKTSVTPECGKQVGVQAHQQSGTVLLATKLHCWWWSQNYVDLWFLFLYLKKSSYRMWHLRNKWLIPFSSSCPIKTAKSDQTCGFSICLCIWVDLFACFCGKLSSQWPLPAQEGSGARTAEHSASESVLLI